MPKNDCFVQGVRTVTQFVSRAAPNGSASGASLPALIAALTSFRTLFKFFFKTLDYIWSNVQFYETQFLTEELWKELQLR